MENNTTTDGIVNSNKIEPEGKKASDGINSATGLPMVSEEDKIKRSRMLLIYVPITIIIFQGIGFGVACLIHFFGDDGNEYERRISIARDNEMGWGFLTVFIWGMCIWIVNVYPEYYKAKILIPGNNWANVFIYQLATEDPNTSSAVVLQTEGDIGKYNRAHRGLYHFVENSSSVVLALPFCLFIYAFPSFVLGTVYAVGRIVYSIGYT